MQTSKKKRKKQRRKKLDKKQDRSVNKKGKTKANRKQMTSNFLWYRCRLKIHPIFTLKLTIVYITWIIPHNSNQQIPESKFHLSQGFFCKKSKSDFQVEIKLAKSFF